MSGTGGGYAPAVDNPVDNVWSTGPVLWITVGRHNGRVSETQDALGPVGALRRIAFLLERSRCSSLRRPARSAAGRVFASVLRKPAVRVKDCRERV